MILTQCNLYYYYIHYLLKAEVIGGSYGQHRVWAICYIYSIVSWVYLRVEIILYHENQLAFLK